MARSYKRDKIGRFAGASGGAIIRAVTRKKKVGKSISIINSMAREQKLTGLTVPGGARSIIGKR